MVHLGQDVWTFQGVVSIVAFCQAGNDLMHVTESVRIPVELHVTRATKSSTATGRASCSGAMETT